MELVKLGQCSQTSLNRSCDIIAEISIKMNSIENVFNLISSEFH